MTHISHPTRPQIAVIEPNVLAAIGLKNLLQEVIPFMEVNIFNSFAEFEPDKADRFVHYFAHVSIVLTNREFFTAHRHKTIVLTNSIEASTSLGKFFSLCTHVSEKEFIKSLLVLEQSAHEHGRNLPSVSWEKTNRCLSEREVEVMAQIVKGYLNKEIADHLNISITTVITHRKNLMEKLHVKSISALTIYAVMNGYVDINTI